MKNPAFPETAAFRDGSWQGSGRAGVLHLPHSVILQIVDPLGDFIMQPDFARKARSPDVGLNDVTERRHVEQELLESREQFRELSAYMEAIREEERTLSAGYARYCRVPYRAGVADQYRASGAGDTCGCHADQHRDCARASCQR